MTTTVTRDKLTRRCFIQGCALTITGIAIHTGTSYPPYTPYTPMLVEQTLSRPQTPLRKLLRKVVVYQDKAHFDSGEILSPYIAPVKINTSTRDYVQRVDAKTLLSRHWFV